jgi:tetratricopeptide (TPR) repeat protein
LALHFSGNSHGKFSWDRWISVIEAQWIAVGISIIAITLAGISILMMPKYLSRSINQGRQGPETSAELRQRNDSEFSPSREYFRQLNEQIDSARTRGASDKANELQTQYEEEMQSWQALESLKRLAPVELGRVSETLNKGDLELLQQLLERTEDLPYAVLSPDSFYLLGNAYHEVGNFHEAIQEFSHCVRIEPAHARARNNRGFSHCNLGQYQQAIRDFNEAIRIKGNFPHAYHNRALAFHSLSKYKEAIRDCTKAINLNPGLPSPYIVRGLSYVNLGKPKKAIRDYNKAIAISPDYSEAYNNRGVAYVNLGQPQQAIQDYGEAIRINPNFVLAYSNRGLALTNVQQHEQAIEDFTTATNLDPGLAQAFHNRGLAHLQLGQNQQALQDYEQAARLDSRFADSSSSPVLTG